MTMIIPTRRAATGTVPLRLDANESAEPPPFDLRSLLADASTTLHRYPQAGPTLAGALANHHRVPPDHVLLGVGSAELITLAWRTFTAPGRCACFGSPAFELYPWSCRNEGVPAVTWPVSVAADLLPGQELLDRTTPGLVALSNPHNPTGLHVPRRAVAELADRLPTGAVLLNDEAYAEYLDDDRRDLSVGELADRSNVVTTRTFSKIYGLAGLRVGYAVGHPDLLRRLAARRTPHLVGQFGALAALRALRNTCAVAGRRAATRRIRSALRAELLQLGFDVPDGCANFLLASRGDGVDLAGRLAAQGVLVKRIQDAVRITLPCAGELDRLFHALRNV